ncbi:MAG: hypothetical protein U0931_14325 [Vulcanimicrobiota bacterium]
MTNPSFPTVILRAPTYSPPCKLNTVDGGFPARELALEQQSQGLPQDVWTPTHSHLLVEKGKPEATMAVLDHFGLDPNRPGLNPGHGEIVASIAMNEAGKGDGNIVRIDDRKVTAAPFPLANSKQFGKELRQFISTSYVQPAEAATASLKEVKARHPHVNTMVQSQGITPSGITEQLAGKALENQAFGDQLAKAVGLCPGVDWTNPDQQVALAKHVQKTLKGSPQAQKAVKELQAQLADGKVKYFNSAGNDGLFQDHLARHGFKFDPELSGNIQGRARGTETVGATTIGPAGAMQQEMPAPYSQRTQAVTLETNGDAHMSVWARMLDGMPVPMGSYDGDGTSFAAPGAAGRYNQNPKAFENLRRNSIRMTDFNGHSAPYIDTTR